MRSYRIYGNRRRKRTVSPFHPKTRNQFDFSPRRPGDSSTSPFGSICTLTTLTRHPFAHYFAICYITEAIRSIIIHLIHLLSTPGGCRIFDNRLEIAASPIESSFHHLYKGKLILVSRFFPKYRPNVRIYGESVGITEDSWFSPQISWRSSKRCCAIHPTSCAQNVYTPSS